jgi:hypothetical protein
VIQFADVQLIGEVIIIRFRIIIHTHLASLARFVNATSIMKDLQTSLTDVCGRSELIMY